MSRPEFSGFFIPGVGELAREVKRIEAVNEITLRRKHDVFMKGRRRRRTSVRSRAARSNVLKDYFLLS